MVENVRPIEELISNHENSRTIYNRELLEFDIDGYDVYNCSLPFEYEGKTYVWGRVEKREEWATSISVLFEKSASGKFVRTPNVESLPIEDPFMVKIHGEYVLGGSHVVKERGKIKTYYVYFYRGKTPFSLKYFTTGPDYMKDIRLVELEDGRIGLFSRPRCQEIMDTYGTESQIGFTIIDSLDDLDAEAIENAKYIPGIFAPKEWGGINQAISFGNGQIGLIGHQCYNLYQDGIEYPVYVNTAIVYDYVSKRISEKKVIGVREDYPPTESKLKALCKCAFTTGILLKDSETVQLYSGLSDVGQGMIEIPNPFKNVKYVTTV